MKSAVILAMVWLGLLNCASPAFAQSSLIDGIGAGEVESDLLARMNAPLNEDGCSHLLQRLACLPPWKKREPPPNEQ